MRKIVFICLFILSFMLLNTNISFALQNTSKLPSITIINLVRGKELGHEKDNLYSSLKAQWQVTSEQKVNATWLLQYSVLEDKQMTDFAKNSMKNQEFGLLFEIDKNFSQKSGVSYRGQGPSYFSDGLLLVSYDLNERKKLIDAAFEKFKNVFGYYPKTVGAWYIGADSLSYMQQKYNIVASLKASDQFNLDVYTIWGAPWSTPYLSSPNNQLIPANSYLESSRVVNLQWAARDPNQGYTDPLFSIQDFGAKGYDSTYVDYLANIFLKSNSDNLVFGLENGGDLKTFGNYYKTMLVKARGLENLHKAKISLAKDFANQFLEQKKPVIGKNYILANDFKSDDQSFWYSNSNYRVYIQKNKDNIYLLDVRNYANKVNEDYLLLNNSQGLLRASSPKILDTIVFPNKKILIQKSDKKIELEATQNKLTLKSDKKILGVFSEKEFSLYKEDKILSYSFSNKLLNINIQEILIIIMGIYFIVSYYLFKKISISLSIFIPLIFSMPFLSNGEISSLSFMFDKKELLMLNLFAIPALFSNLSIIFLFQLLPFEVLLFANFLYLWKKTKQYKYVYLISLLTISLLFANVFYFPLDKSTIKVLLIFVTTLILTHTAANGLIYKFTRSKQLFLKLLLVLFTFLVLFSITVFFSRTKTVLTAFEIQALQLVKSRGESVIYVSQTDFNVKPIYKAVKPFLYENINLAEKLTGTKWTNIERPQDNVLKLTDYKNKLIFIPRYLGSDLSKYEEERLNITKVFDNYQIAIYEQK